MSENNKSSVPSVLNPYRDTALEYRKAGFMGPLPLPYKEKHPPPLDFTKRVSPYPTLEQIENWRNGLQADGKNKMSGSRHNICVRLAGVDKDHELLGIDVDDYLKGDKKKEGASQLLRLENQLGPLPDTWISSARTDGKSGIRYYRVPRGLAFRGKVDKDIEVIRKGHRFAVVWPSIHPDGGTYWWFPPGIAPGKNGKEESNGGWTGDIPDARLFPILPDAWIEYLTNGRTLATDDEIIDVDSSVQDLYDWATDTFHGDDDSPICTKMQEKLELHKRNVEDEATSHDKLTNGHWNLLRLAAEGHLGWNAAVNELESHFATVTIQRGKRGIDEVNGEIFRSRIQALRKVKGQCDERAKIGAKPVDPLCTKIGLCGEAPKLSLVVSENSKNDDGTVSESNDSSDKSNNDSGGSDDSGGPPDELDDVPQGGVRGVPDYEMNDDGNAKQLIDMFSTHEFGPSLRFAEGRGWLIWHQGNKSAGLGSEGDRILSHQSSVGENGPRWEVDELGNQQVRRMWQRVQMRQRAYGEACYGDYLQKLQDFVRGVNNITNEDVKLAKSLALKWQRFAESSGNNRNAENAIRAAQSISGVSISVNSLDQNPLLLGVANGVVELDRSEIRLREAQLNDFITLNTGVSYREPSHHAQKIWQEYLDTFLPDPELQQVVQVVMGHTLIGGNPEKIMVVLKGDPNTGKSTMIGAIEAALGDYAQSVNQSVFQNHKLNPVLARSLNKRVILCSEFDEQDSLSASQVKRLTGGSDKIQAELKGSNVTIEGVPQFVPILATNAVPTISGSDKALQNRLYVIPFNIVPSTIRKENTGVIERVCREAVLYWLVEGYRKYREQGRLPQHQDIINETEEFFSELDPVATFLYENVAKVSHADHADAYIKPAVLYQNFKLWWRENEYPERDKPSQNKFSRTVKSMGYQQKQVRVNGESSKFWVGVKMKKKASVVVDMNSVANALKRGTTKDGTTSDE